MAPYPPRSISSRTTALTTALSVALTSTAAQAADPGGTPAQVQGVAVAAARSSTRAIDAPSIQSTAQASSLEGTLQPQVAVGLDGTHQLTPTGGLEYRIPIEVPRWSGGVGPDLAIVYDSQAATGPLGVGATLTGLPTIVRTVDEHGVSYGTASDRFAVSWSGGGAPASPGGLLVADPDRAGSFRTASDSWTRFEPVGDCGGGPCAWRATRPDGTVLTFGGKADATLTERAGGGHGVRGIRTWALSHIADQDGNAFTVSYDEDDAMLYPRRIVEACAMGWGDTQPWQVPGAEIPDDPAPLGEVPPVLPTLPGDFTLDPDAPYAVKLDPWLPLPTGLPNVVVLPGTSGAAVEPTATATCAQLRAVEFVYLSTARQDPTPLPDRHARVLDAINVNGPSGRIHQYKLGYQTSPVTGATRLRTITRFGVATGGGAAPSEPATTLTWGSQGSWRSVTGAASVVTQATWPAVPSDGRIETLVGDVTGDGRDDVVRVTTSPDRLDARVAIATGGAEPMGAVSAALPLPTGQGSESGDWRDWRVALADLDVDGRKDLVVALAHRHRGRVLVARGQDGGLGPLVDYGHHAALDAFVDPRVVSAWHRLVVGDVNGDQADDLLIVDLAHHDVAVILGATGGPQPPIVRSTGSDGAPGFWHTEPQLADLDGDGVLDLALIENRSRNDDLAAGARLFAFLGSRRDGLRQPDEIALASDIEIGTSPYQALPGDVDGDGVTDLITAYTGLSNTPDAPARRPFGRDLRVAFGDWQLQRDEVVEVGWRAAVADPSDLPDLNLDRGEQSTWIHASGDLDGDGCADVIAHYAGARGELLEVHRADCRGGFRPVERHTLAATAPDGGAQRHRIRARLLDLDQDGYHDLIRYYAGSQGQWIEVAFGGATGLAPTTTGRFRRILNETAATGAVAEGTDPDDGGRASSVELLVGDWNGDGRRDLALAHPGRTLTGGAALRLAVAPTSTTTTGPDQVTQIANGYGATVSVEYTSPVAAGAIDRAATCAQADAAACGLPATWARPLATRVTVRDGRAGTPARSTRYTYRNGRYYPGFGVAGDAPSTARALRADLAFAQVIATDEQLGAVTTTTYRQDAPFHRQIATLEVAAPVAHGAGSWPGAVARRRTSYQYEHAPTIERSGRVEAAVVRPTEVRLDDQELGIPSRNLVRTLRYGPYGAVTNQVECADGACVETEVQHSHDRDRWIVNRERARIVRRAEPTIDLVLSWRTTDYDGDRVSAIHELVCADSMRCQCEADADACVADRRAAWVTVASGMTYDPRGNLTRTVDAVGAVTTTVWDPTGTQPETITRWVDHDGVAVPVATTVYYDNGGRPREQIASWWGPGVTAVPGWPVAAPPAGVRTTRQYDGLGRPSRVDHPDGAWETWQYPSTGTVTAQAVRHERSLDATRSAVVTTYYDGLGQVYREIASGPTLGQTLEVRTERAIRADASGVNLLRRRVSSPRFTPSSGDPVGLWTETTYDALELPIRVARVRGTATTTTTSTDLERIIRIGRNTSHQRARAELAADGSLVGAIEWLSETREQDSRGRLRAIDGEHATRAEYWYDAALRLERIVGPFQGAGPGDQWSGWSYDSRGRVIAEYDSARGDRYYSYDDRGRPVARVDELGRSVTWTYDALGRPTTQTSDEGTDEWTYDAPTVVRSLGRQTGVAGRWGRDDVLAFDAAGRPTQRERTIGALTRQVLTTSYDHQDRPVSHTLPDGSRLSWTYDLAGNLTTLDLGSTRYLTQSSFDANGRPRTRVTRSSDVTLDHDALGSLRELTATSVVTGAEQLALGYTYSSLGQVTSVSDLRSTTLTGAIDTSATAVYEFDRLGRLTGASDATGAFTQYAFDPAGNLTRRGELEFVPSDRRLSVARAAVVNPCAVPAGQPIPPGCTAQPAIALYHLDYDVAGNLIERRSTTGATWGYRYDSFDRLTESVDPDGLSATMTYAVDGLRVSRVEQDRSGETITYFVDPFYEVRVRDGDLANAVATVHVHAPGVGALASITTSTLAGTASLLDAAVNATSPLHDSPVAGYRKGTIYYLTDHLGTPVVVMNGLTNELTRYRHDPWGSHDYATSTGTDLTDLGFTGQRRDASLGLVYYGARYYDPLVGRFTTADSVLPDGGASLRGLNRYAYAFGDPINFTDPTGHEPEPFSATPSGRPDETWRRGTREMKLTDSAGREIYNPDVRATNRQFIAGMVKTSEDKGTVDSPSSGITLKGIWESLLNIGRNSEGENTVAVDVGPVTVEVAEKDGVPAVAVELGVGKEGEIGPIQVEASLKAAAKATVNPGADGYFGDTETSLKAVLKAKWGEFAIEFEKSTLLDKDRWRVRHVQDWFSRTREAAGP